MKVWSLSGKKKGEAEDGEDKKRKVENMGVWQWILGFFGVLILLGFVIDIIRIISQGNVYIVEFLGKYQTTWESGLHFKIPVVQQVVKEISLKEQVSDFESQSVITKDNIVLAIDSVLFYKVVDPVAYTYEVEDPLVAIKNLVATSLRDVLGSMTLDQSLTSREKVNAQMQINLAESMSKWGIELVRIELKDIMPPADIMKHMEMQMRAERERREEILTAEGKKASSKLDAEADREARLIRAEAYKKEQEIMAEADKQVRLIKAEAYKEEQEVMAKGNAQAMLEIQEAVAKSLEKLNESKPTQETIALKSLESLEKLAEGQATKIVVPSDIQGLAGLATVVGTMAEKKE